MTKTHRMTGTPTYKSWLSMHGRCKGQSSDPAHYVSKGITVCAEWASFERFLADMGPRPPGMTIDRIDGANGYTPGNCRWATTAQQMRNRRSTINLTHAGRTMCLKDWAHELGINYGTAVGRARRGLPTELILSTSKLHARSGRWTEGVVRA